LCSFFFCSLHYPLHIDSELTQTLNYFRLWTWGQLSRTLKKKFPKTQFNPPFLWFFSPSYTSRCTRYIPPMFDSTYWSHGDPYVWGHTTSMLIENIDFMLAFHHFPRKWRPRFLRSTHLWILGHSQHTHSLSIVLQTDNLISVYLTKGLREWLY